MQENIVGLLKHLQRNGVQLALNAQGQLVSQSAREAITAELGELIRSHRDAIVRCLRARQAFEAPIAARGATGGPLSSSQSGLWFIEQYEERSHLYNMPVFFRLRGALDVAALAFAFDALVARHASLRTRFVRDEAGHGRQEILPHRGFALQQEDYRALPEAVREARVAERVRAEIERPFDLASGELTRVHLLRLADSEHVLLINQHHIISDGWSVKNLFAELKTAFLAYQNREPLSWGEPALNFIDYAHWFNSPSFRQYHDEYRAFWVERLQGIPEVHSLPLDHPRPARQGSAGAVVFSRLDNARWARWCALCRRYNTSPFIGLHALFALLLARHSGERDIVVGTPLAYRERPEIEGLLGFFVNTLVLRTRLPERQRFCDYLLQCREDDLAAFDHQLFRFEALIEALGLGRHTAINPVFQIMLVYQARVDFDDLIPGCSALEETSPALPAKTDISVKVTELMDEVRIDWLYATALFERATIEDYAARLLCLLDAVLEDPEADIWRLPMTRAADLAALDARVQALPRGYPAGQTALGAFEARLRAQPDAPALFAGEPISYAELDARAGRLAHWLVGQGAAGRRVGILARRENAFAEALLAVWKAGAAYVPLDPAQPAERIAHIVADAELALVLGTGEAAFASVAVRWVDIAAPALLAQLASYPSRSPALEADPQALAQVIYTSGSTGQPKGVMIEHGALLNLLRDHGRRLQIGPGDRMLDCMSLSFDAGNMCALLPLVHGAALLWAEPDERLLDAIEVSRATHMIFATAVLAALPYRRLPTLKAVGFGGEACPAALVERWAGEFRLINMYGPTEATVTALTCELAVGARPSIGQPIDGMQALILDEQGQPCPPGVPGELCLAGLGLARGYLNQPQRTTQAFRMHRLAGREVRLYHSGDRARQRGDGCFEYLGRLDEQIKLRGYRIEPGEIEAQLTAACPALRQVKVVLAGEGRRQALVAYAAVDAMRRPSADALLQDVARRLPDYMVPARLVLLEQLPLTANGKLDGRRLPAVTLDTEPAVPAAGALEAEVLRLWQTVLERPCGVECDFFALGGDSILSIQLTTRLREAGHACSVREVFEARTVRRLCRVLGQPREVQAVVAEQGVLDDQPFALQPIQQWFFEQPFASPQHWNQGVVVSLPAAVGVAELMDLMRALLQQHDALRLAVSPDGQRYLPHVPLRRPAELDAAELGAEGLQAALRALQSRMQPEQGRTLAWALIERLPGGGRGLFVAFHHLVIDAVSWRILLDDLARLARGEALPPKTSSYRQWGRALEAYAQRAEHQLDYWRALVAGMPRQTSPGWPRSTQAQQHALRLDAALSARLSRDIARRHGADLRELLLAALTRTLHELGFGPRQWIMLEGHGREPIDPSLDLSRTLGWFTSQFPVALDDRPDWVALVAEAVACVRAVPDKGVGYLPLRQRWREALPLPLIALNYLGSYGSGGGDWQALPLAPGRPSATDNPSAELVSLHGGLFDGCLVLRQIGCLQAEASERLLDRLRGNLLALAESEEPSHACA